MIPYRENGPEDISEDSGPKEKVGLGDHFGPNGVPDGGISPWAPSATFVPHPAQRPAVTFVVAYSPNPPVL